MTMNLRARLDHSARFDAEYGPNLASHLPMALVALARLGADDARLADFAARYATRLHPAPPPQPWPAGQPWQSRFGDPAAWPAYRSLFNAWFDDEGAPAVLAQALPALLRGVGAAAFHGPIRAAYALAAGHSHELADALAYWACRWFSLGTPPAVGPARDPAAVLARLRLPMPQRPLIAERMALAAAQPAFAATVAAYRVDPDTMLAQLAALAARLYAASGNFTALHLVTSAHAMRVLLPWVDEDDAAAALGHYWLAYAAGYAASDLNSAGRAHAPAGPPRSWAEMVARAVASDDDHLIKLVDSCREQERAYGGTVWREAASRAVAGA